MMRVSAEANKEGVLRIAEFVVGFNTQSLRAIQIDHTKAKLCLAVGPYNHSTSVNGEEGTEFY